MSNRILWILILFLIFISGYFFYQYFFVYNLVKLKISSNVENYKVELYAKKVGQTFNFECKEKKCILEDISPFSYDLEIIKFDYLSFKKDIEIKEGEDFYLDIVLEKNTSLEKLEIKEISGLEKKIKISPKEKIEALRKKNKNYLIIKLKDNREFYFVEKNWKLDLIYDKNKIWTFDKIEKSKLLIREVIWNRNFILINIANNKYLYDIVSGKMISINLKIPINYIKKWLNDTEFLLVTSKWTFIYSLLNESIEYFIFFKDYIYFLDYYIWVINFDEKTKLINLWLESEKENLIIRYNPNTKEKKVLYKTGLSIEKIIKNKDKVIITNEKGEEYELKNF